MIERIRYFVREGFRSIWVNRMMSLASVLVLSICLVMLGTTMLSSLNIGRIISQLEAKNQIMVFLKSNATQAQIDEVGSAIQAMPNVQSSKFLSKDDIFSQAKQELGKQDASLIAGLSSSDFDCAYQVQIKDLSQYEQTVNALSKLPSVKTVRQDIDLARVLSNISRAVNIAGFWLFVIMAVVALFLISNTIKLAMFSRKREINIMKFVGATDWFIRWPFIIEGILIGIIAGAVALLVQWYVYTHLVVKLFGVLKVVAPLDYFALSNTIAPAFLLAGALVGALGSVLSVHRYLKV